MQNNHSKLEVDALTAKQAQAEHARLEAEIRHYDEAYYQKDAPAVPDAEYDALRRRYEAIEARFPDLRTLTSLSHRVGAPPARGFAKVRHAVPMLSLSNAFLRMIVACGVFACFFVFHGLSPQERLQELVTWCAR